MGREVETNRRVRKLCRVLESPDTGGEVESDISSTWTMAQVGIVPDRR